eukprot:16442520-Heterocapsa_arctica.AAC.1
MSEIQHSTLRQEDWCTKAHLKEEEASTAGVNYDDWYGNKLHILKRKKELRNTVTPCLRQLLLLIMVILPRECNIT